ncbi:MAG: protein kinase domain-containing protein [Prosthecobacter sp.]|uniref:protein kinase domain-containing protein n=1 Tax=Prosthecobacter sp. TaxID=1965333 RepID=UPI00390351BF
MNTPNQCPQCGAALPKDAPESLCPACLMSGALPSQSNPDMTMLVEKPKPRVLPTIGEMFGSYRIERELGRGGMGAVYAAEQLESGRRVALKVLSHQLDSADARARFLREGRLAASINHPNSVYVFGTEEIEGTPVIAMELIAGGTLQDRIQHGGALPVGVAVDAALQIIAGLEAAQAIGILHRDIKPANCFTDLDGSVKVGDFGLSISTAGRGESHLTLDGTFLGTPAFCSPEQLRGDELNVRSDMYSVGVTLFYLLTGRTPFEGKNMVQLLANALEKTAPSPTQFRAEVPDSLSRVVLRCLEKLPASRFASYEELRRALLPFSSTAPTPATLGLRFVAMAVDTILIAVLNWTVMGLYYGDFITDPTPFQSAEWLWISLGLFGLQLCYWGMLEGVWGASVGKVLVGLRVARLNRSAPGIPRAMARRFILSWTTLASYVVFSGSYFKTYDAMSHETQMQSFGFIAFGAAYVLCMFVTARRKNGFAAVHDLLTGTRVIQKSAYQPRTVVTQTEAVVAPTEAMPKLGPYHLLSTLSTSDRETISLGYDTRLLRKVWIRQCSTGEPPLPQALRNLARPARLRWLQGERNAGETWDAYEAVGGAPLVNLLHERQPWDIVRHWLHDLSSELDVAAKDGTLPDAPSLDRLWITTDGRVKLLNFTAPGAEATSPATAGNIFLNQVAKSALEGRIVSAQEAEFIVEAPLALGARAVLRDLATPLAVQDFTARLKPLLQTPPCVSWWKRLVTVLACAAPALGIGAFMLLGAMLVGNWRTTQPELMPMMTTLAMHQQMETGGHMTDKTLGYPLAEGKTALEIVIAGRYGQLVRDPKRWSSGTYKLMIEPEQRAEVERIVAAHPQVSDEELQQAEAKLKPLLGAVDNETADGKKLPDAAKIMRTLGHILVNWLLVAIAGVSLVCALVFRCGPLFRVLGIAVVTRDGAEASRPRMLGRACIAWSPVLISALMIQLANPDIFEASLPQYAAQAALIVILVIASLALRQRGLQDRLAGTWLVPG